MKLTDKARAQIAKKEQEMNYLKRQQDRKQKQIDESYKRNRKGEVEDYSHGRQTREWLRRDLNKISNDLWKKEEKIDELKRQGLSGYEMGALKKELSGFHQLNYQMVILINYHSCKHVKLFIFGCRGPGLARL